jgi:hypothetical protein
MSPVQESESDSEHSDSEHSSFATRQLPGKGARHFGELAAYSSPPEL